jgi:hypothetical protein
MFFERILMGSYRKLVRAVCVLLSALALGGTASAAQASSIVWKANGGSVPMYWGTRSWSGVKAWLPNSSHFQMVCWVDDQWYYGNYWSNRWFFGQSYATGDWGSVPASYVYYQVWVPHC